MVTIHIHIYKLPHPFSSAKIDRIYSVTFNYVDPVCHYCLFTVTKSIPFYRIVPLFWTQSGYGLKPPPQLSKDRTHEQTINALKRHMTRIVNNYGALVSTSVVPSSHCS